MSAERGEERSSIAPVRIQKKEVIITYGAMRYE